VSFFSCDAHQGVVSPTPALKPDDHITSAVFADYSSVLCIAFSREKCQRRIIGERLRATGRSMRKQLAPRLMTLTYQHMVVIMDSCSRQHVCIVQCDLLVVKPVVL